MIKYSLFLLLLLSTACSSSTPSEDVVKTTDTIVSKRDVLNTRAGSTYLKASTEYALVLDGDTSSFRPIVDVPKDDGYSVLDMNIGSATNDSLRRTHAFHMAQLKQLLPYIINDHMNDTLKSIGLGTLTQMGDASVALTKAFRKQYPNMNLENVDQAAYDTVRHFIGSSSLAKEFNDLFAPYHLTISRAYLEKIFFISSDDLEISGTKLADTTDVPEKLLFCFIGFGLCSTDVD